jgi:hypothetical protein
VTLSFAVVCEAPADQRTGCDLADRVFVVEVGWLEQEMLPHCRQWRGQDPSEPHLLWRNVNSLARSQRIRAHGHFEGEPGAPDAHAARLALLLIRASLNPADAVVLLRDDDRQTERRRGLEQARRSSGTGIPVVIGLAHPKRECWVLAGYEPRDQEETDALNRARRELGFDPRQHAEGLTAKHLQDKRNAERLLETLSGGVWQRQADCWKHSDFEILKDRGVNTGLTAYLEEVRRLLVPLFSGRSGDS